MKIFMSYIFLLVFLLISCSENFKDIEPQELRVISLNKEIMCPVCPGESIDQSQNDLAIQMRFIVTKLVDEGKSDEEIKEYFVQRYGEVVLMEPSRKGLGLIAWTVPWIAFLFTIFMVIFFIRKMSSSNNSREVE
ncbi:MAG: cytochrome C biogenesis protein CcmH [Chloroflexi bacterium]|nr:cytochrome C biogenesis protein CcmH [Chloroflexota bacterium]|tara:strand:+ start:7107 stop:7511 length:405 start_codon:yes stop_codon:yes gene_type:complete